MRAVILLALAFSGVVAASTSTTDKNVDFDSRCFNPYVKTSMPDQVREVDDVFVLALNQFATSGPDATSLKCGAINPVVSLDATTDANGCDIGGDGDNPTLSCTLADTTLNAHTTTVTFDNDVGSAVTRQFDWTVTDPAPPDPPDPGVEFIGIQETETGQLCDLFVAGDGNDLNNCDSHAQRCRTLERIEALPNPASGSNLCVGLNTTVTYTTGRYDTTWGGTAADWAVTRCYKMSGSTPVECNDTTDKPNWPLIDGPYNVGIEATYGSPNGNVLMWSINHDYNVIEKFRCTDARGHCFGNLSGSGQSHSDSNVGWIIIRDIVAEHLSYGAVQFYHDQHHILIQRVYSDETSLCKYFQNPNYSGCTTSNFAGATLGVTTNGDVIIADNEIHNHRGGEGIACLRGHGTCILRGNYVGSTSSVNLYFDNASGLMENNFAWFETGEPMFKEPGGRGIWHSREQYGSCAVAPFDTSSIVRLNKLANVGSILFGAHDMWFQCAGAYTQAMRLYHNTGVMGDRGVNFSINTSGTLSKYERLSGINNAIVGCSMAQKPTGDWNNNGYVSNPADSDCDGTGDVYEAENFAGTVWDSYGIGNLPTDADFTPNAGSDLIDAGRYLTRVNDPGGGTGVAFVVDDARLFTDGYDCTGCVNDHLIEGDVIQVGADTGLVIEDINYTTNTITVDQSFTWADNDDVCLTSCTSDIGWDGDL